MRTRSYNALNLPFIPDVEAYSEKWISWWTSCQPGWRQNERWPLPTEGPETEKWAFKVCARGQNGLFLVIMSTAWWASSIQSEKDWDRFDQAVDDLTWVIGKGIQNYETLPSPPPAPTVSEEPVISCATGTVRAEGKRQSKTPGRFLR